MFPLQLPALQAEPPISAAPKDYVTKINFDMRGCVVLGGRSHPDLVARICRHMDVEETPVNCGNFSNGESSVVIGDSVREKHVYVIQSACGDVNTSFIELLIMVSACKAASAQSVTLVLPLFPYSRQVNLHNAIQIAEKRKKDGIFENTNGNVPPSPSRPGISRQVSSLSSVGGDDQYNSGYKYWIAQSGALIANLLMCTGIDNVITMDLHDPQYQGFFDLPIDNLYGRPLLQQFITEYIPNYKEAVIVSPDAGGAKRATAIADRLGLGFALIHKDRRNNATILVGDVEERIAIIVDDLVDTARTVVRAAKVCKDNGATTIWTVCTHGIFSGDALDYIKKSPIDEVVTTNSVPQINSVRKLGSHLHVVDVSQIFAEAIRRIHNGESISMLFDHALGVL